MAVMAVDAGAPAAVKQRLEAFAGEVLAAAMKRSVQRVNGALYLRGLLEAGARKSLEPMVGRLGGDADYQSMQQFLADSPWDPALVVQAVAERVAPEIGVEAWVLDDTGFPKDGKDSPGVKRQYSGTLRKVGNCQIGVSLHAVGARGTVPLGWALYLPQEWCSDEQRRRKAKIPTEVQFQTKLELGVQLAVDCAGWALPRGAILGDCAYGNSSQLRGKLDAAGLQYVLAVAPETKVFGSDTSFELPPARGAGRVKQGRPLPDRAPEPIGELIGRLGESHLQTLCFRDGPDDSPMRSRFIVTRVRSAHDWNNHEGCWFHTADEPPPQQWLIAEWPEGHAQPIEYWLSNLAPDTTPQQLARLARLRWKIELDYKQLKGELGLDHYEGRSWLGWYHHTALVTAAHGFLTLERLNPFHPRPA